MCMGHGSRTHACVHKHKPIRQFAGVRARCYQLAGTAAQLKKSSSRKVEWFHQRSKQSCAGFSRAGVHTKLTVPLFFPCGIHPKPQNTQATLEHFIVQKNCLKNWREFCLCQERLYDRCCSTCTQPPPARLRLLPAPTGGRPRHTSPCRPPFRSRVSVAAAIQIQDKRGGCTSRPPFRFRISLAPRVNVAGHPTCCVSPRSRQRDGTHKQ